MIFLVLAILGSGLIPVLFRAFHDWRVHVLWAIPTNYLVCVFIGAVWGGQPLDLMSLPSQPWVALALLQGVILAVNFFLLAYTAQRAGVSVAALASRLSVAIPSLLAFAIYDDSLNVFKGAGLAAALLSLYLCTASERGKATHRSLWVTLLPLLVFFTFGCYFTIIKYAQAHYLDETTYHPYVMSGFLFAFLTSLAICLRRALTGVEFGVKHLLGGILLGTVNYIAVYALVKMLALHGWQSSQLYPLYSVGVVGVSTFLAVIFFREKLSRQKTVGLVVGLIAVAMLNQ
jgi:multidrug transporter EmrE-like cation transporter